MLRVGTSLMHCTAPFEGLARIFKTHRPWASLQFGNFQSLALMKGCRKMKISTNLSSFCVCLKICGPQSADYGLGSIAESVVRITDGKPWDIMMQYRKMSFDVIKFHNKCHFIGGSSLSFRNDKVSRPL